MNHLKLLAHIFTLFLFLVIVIFNMVLFSSFDVPNETEESIAFCGVVSSYPSHIDGGLGKKLFKANCASCHNKNMKSDMTGPALGGAFKRGWNDRDTLGLQTYLNNPRAYIDSGKNPYMVELDKTWNSEKNAFPDLTLEEVKALLYYIEAW